MNTYQYHYMQYNKKECFHIEAEYHYSDKLIGIVEKSRFTSAIMWVILT